jgi:hypothetical protein
VRRKPNPKVAGLPCALCKAPAESFCHHRHAGMGGDPQHQRTQGWPSCGVDHWAPGCHRDYAHGLFDVEFRDGVPYVYFHSHELAAQRGYPSGRWAKMRYHGRTYDEMGEST